MELELGAYLRPFSGPWARAACTPGLVEVEEGERRFVVEESGPDVMPCLEELIAGRGYGTEERGRENDPLQRGRDKRYREGEEEKKE